MVYHKKRFSSNKTKPQPKLRALLSFAPKAQLAAPQVLVHAVHAAAVAATCRSSLLLGNLNHQSFGGEQQTGD